MKSLLTAFLLLISVQTYAQTRTGTGPDISMRNIPIIDSEIVTDLSFHSPKCGNKKSKTYIHLLDFYIQQNSIKPISELNNTKVQIDCSDKEKLISAEVKCHFTDKRTIEKLKEILKSKKAFVGHYESEFEISEKESEALYNYYQKVLKEIEDHAKKAQ